MSELLVHAGIVVTGAEAEPVLRDGWVLVQDGRVVEVSDREPHASEGAARLDAPGSTLLPGLIDCHVHLALSGGPDWLSEVKQSYALAAWRAARFARQTLRAGFTTVRTLGGRDGMDPALRDAVASGEVEGPRVVPANLAVCMTGGHGAWIGREADGADDVRRAVREQLRAGAECIKVIATGGVMTPGVQTGSQQLTQDEMHAAVEEAHKAGVGVAAHAHGADGVRAAVLAGVDSIEHGSFLTDETVRLMVERGTFLSATLVAASSIADAPPGSVPEWARAKAQEAAAAAVASFQRAHAAGVRMVLGTDAGTPYNLHGDNARELSLMVRHGLSPLEALLAATRNAAELLRKQADLGTIAPGKQADLVLCDGDVLADVDLLRRPGAPRAVIQGGRVVAPGEALARG